MARRFVPVLLGLLLVSFVAPFAVHAASDSSFSIAPAPIANPVFDEKQTDMKVRATYLTMESTDPATQFDLSGYGIDITGRTAFGNKLALDFNLGIMALDGTMVVAGSSTDLTGMTIPISVNLEVQPYKNDVFNIILFAGPAFSMSSMWMDSGGYTYYIDSYVYGLQGGLQMGFRLGDVHIDAFGMTTSQSGTQDLTSTNPMVPDTSSDIPSYTTTSFGMDFMHVPSGLTLSSILQEADQSEGNGFKTHLYTLSWSHKF